MSVKALNKSTKTIDVPDELESFLHVLLYIALRLLPHNCTPSSVPRLLHKYFDDFAPVRSEYYCGPLKQTTIQVGYLDIQSFIVRRPGSSSGGKQELVFFYHKASAATDPDEEEGSVKHAVKQPLPPVDPETGKLPVHPIDGVVRKLLSWHSAYHALTSDAPVSSDAALDIGAEEPISEEVAEILKAKAEAEARAERIKRRKAGSSSMASQPASDIATIVQPPEIEKSAQDVPNNRADLMVLAKNLESHKPMLDLIEDVLTKKKWPDEDRCTDKKPKKPYVPPDQVPAGSLTFLPGSRKRNSQAVDDDPPATPPRPSKQTKV